MQSQIQALAQPGQDHSPHLNALKHGLRSDRILMPTDDAGAFGALRHELYRLYWPINLMEARCVEAMAGCQWRIARCWHWQAKFDADVEAQLYPPAGAAQLICDRDSHVWQHKADDCTRQEMRMERTLSRALDKLLLLQKLRGKRPGLGPASAEPLFWLGASPLEDVDPEAGYPNPFPTSAGADAMEQQEEAHAPCPVGAERDPPPATAPIQEFQHSVANVEAVAGSPPEALSSSAAKDGGLGGNGGVPEAPAAPCDPPLREPATCGGNSVCAEVAAGFRSAGTDGSATPSSDAIFGKYDERTVPPTGPRMSARQEPPEPFRPGPRKER